MAGLPKVGRDKYEKLETVLTKVITRELNSKQVLNTDQAIGMNGEDKVEPFTIDMPIVPGPDNVETTVGFCYLTFRDSFEASNAAKYLSHVGLDSKHFFRVCRIDDFETAISESGESERPVKVGFSRVRLADAEE